MTRTDAVQTCDRKFSAPLGCTSEVSLDSLRLREILTHQHTEKSTLVQVHNGTVSSETELLNQPRATELPVIELLNKPRATELLVTELLNQPRATQLPVTQLLNQPRATELPVTELLNQPRATELPVLFHQLPKHTTGLTEQMGKV